jgi:ABC-type multidrug transport system fused ATPase/permease subunit
MNFRATISEINAIVPPALRKKLHRFMTGLFIFSLLDLISIAYLIPAILLLLDKNKLALYLSRFNIPADILSQEKIIISVLVLVVFYVIKNLTHARFNVRLYQFLYGMSHSLSMKLLESHLNGDFLMFQQENKGSLIQEITSVTRDFSVTMLGSLLFLLSEGLTFSIITIVLLCFYFKLTISAIAAVSVFTFTIYRIKKTEVSLINNTYKQASAQANAELLNLLDGYVEIKTSGNHKPFLDRFRVHNKALNHVTALLTSSSGNYSKYLELFLIAGIAGLIITNIALAGNTENFLLISILGALSIKIVPSLSKILNMVTMFNSHYYSIGRLKNINAPQEKTLAYATFQSSFELKNIKFGYPGNELFEDLNFTISPSIIAALHGVTGSGKTTLLQLIGGLIKPAKGEIHIDGTHIGNNCFLPFVSYVSQQPFIFNGSIADNITMLQPRELIDVGYIHYLLEALALDVAIEQLPDGINTIINHNTSRLSGGQKQRLSLVRALYHRPKLLILDESTNQQNEEMEARIYKLLQKLASAENMSVVTVSHNSGIDLYCDIVYSLQNGQLEKLSFSAS